MVGEGGTEINKETLARKPGLRGPVPEICTSGSRKFLSQVGDDPGQAFVNVTP